MSNEKLKVALAQFAPVWLDKAASLKIVSDQIEEASSNSCEMLVFGEAFVPGYPFWSAYTGGARFDDPMQKEIHAHYVKEAVCLEDGDLDEICAACKKARLNLYLGIIEKPVDRGGTSLYCSLVFINQNGEIASVHRKLMPTYEERLSWSIGDGNGLQVHSHGAFKIGGLNCWENWMPLARAALYAQAENVHVAVWPGCDHNTRDITRFIARESRSYVLSVSSLLNFDQAHPDIPHFDLMRKHAPELLANGGSCIAGPNGEWIVEPIVDSEGLIFSELSFDAILEERQNFDPSGHYSRPDVLSLSLNTKRQSVLTKV